MASYFVYIVRTNTNHLYIGHSDDLERREWEHRHHAHGAKYLKDTSRRFELVYSEPFATRAAAMKREKQLKGWTRVKKEALVAGDFERLKRL